MSKQSVRWPITHFLDRYCIERWLSIATNLLTLGTAIGVVAGCFLVWRYLDRFGLGDEIITLLGSPHYLLVAAISAFFVSVSMMVLILIAPYMLRVLSDPIYHRKRNRPPDQSWFLHAGLCFAFMTLFGFAVINDAKDKWLVAVYCALVAIVVLVVCWWYGGPASQEMKNKPAKGNWVNYIFLLVAVSLLLCTLLVYGFLVIGELAFRVVESRAVIYVLIWLGCALYSLAITRVVYMRDSLIGYLPACVFGVFILGFFFSNMSNNIIASLKIGHFEDTLHVSRDVVQHVGEKHGFNLVDMPSEDFLVIENAWVIANLPGQIIISAGYDSKEKLSIPRQKLQSRTYWFE